MLTTDGNISFAIFIYLELEWYESPIPLGGDKFGESGMSGMSGISGVDPMPIRYSY